MSEHITRQQRRQKERQEMADWKKQYRNLPTKQNVLPILDGIKTQQWKEGYEAGIKYGTSKAMFICYAAVGLVLRHLLGFGHARIQRFIQAMDAEIVNCIDEKDAVERLYHETGYRMRFRDGEGVTEVDDL